jgi:DNA/RNA endonuclease G (NUC1)
MPPAADLKELAFALDHLKSCKGYLPKFIDGKTSVSLSVLSPKQIKLLPAVDGNKKGQLHYSSFTVLYNTKRKVPFFSASNIDLAKKNENTKRASAFVSDPRIKDTFQLSKKFYDLEKDFTEFEIGHMASNDEMSWGPGNAAQISAYESFHFPNSVPQAERLNSGLWRSLEQYIIAEGGSASNKKIGVLTGPVLAKNDPVYKKDKTFQVPLLFWKVIIFQWGDKFWSTGFMMSHEKRLRDDLKILIYPKKPKRISKAAGPVIFNDFKYKKVFQVNLDLIEKHTGLRFKWKKVKRVEIPVDALQLKKIGGITSATDIKAIKKKKLKLNMVLPGK